MRNLIVIKNFIDPEILQKINDDLMRCLENFLIEEKKLGGQRYWHLNATIGHHADTILGQVNEKGLLKKIEKEKLIFLIRRPPWGVNRLRDRKTITGPPCNPP